MEPFGFLLIPKALFMDIKNTRSQFPIFKAKKLDEHPFIYFDNASTTHKPQQVIDAITSFYSSTYANIGRGSYSSAHKATTQYEAVRNHVAQFINAKSNKEVIFTSGTTDGINKLAFSYFKAFAQPGDQVLISSQGHHSNRLIWEELASDFKLSVKEIPCHSNGEIDLVAFEKMCQFKTTLVAIEAGTNAFGTLQPISELIDIAHGAHAKVLVDAAQWINYSTTDVQAWDCDFMVFSAHKMYGPTGLGVLYGKSEWLNRLPPLSMGGGAVLRTIPDTLFKDSPHKHEAGTPHMAGVMGLEAALKFVEEIGFDRIKKHADELLNYLLENLRLIDGVVIYQHLTTPALPIVSFNLSEIHPHDMAAFLNESNICLRAGHHCAQPALAHEGLTSTLRASLAIYNTKSEIDILVKQLLAAQKFFA